MTFVLLLSLPIPTYLPRAGTTVPPSIRRYGAENRHVNIGDVGGATPPNHLPSRET